MASILRRSAPLVLSAALAACSSLPPYGAVSPEEYYSLGQAYYDLKNYGEAEKWFLRSRGYGTTRSASEYRLGQIAFQLKRYEEAAAIFEGLLADDGDNVLLLKAAAFARLRKGDFSQAERHYGRVLALVPESPDSTYNYALLLYAMQKYGEAESFLAGFVQAWPEDRDALLLLARTQGKLRKPEALERYAEYLAQGESGENPQAVYEYAGLCEELGYFGRALENYGALLSAPGSKDFTRGDLRFRKARVLLLSGESGWREELDGAVKEGFKDAAALEALAGSEKAGADQKQYLETVLNSLR